MKIRHGFISNSSSASFVVALCDITQKQQESLLSYENPTNEYWKIAKVYGLICGDTMMDNGDMSKFLNTINIKSDVVRQCPNLRKYNS